MSNQVVLITGSSRGFGQLTAEALVNKEYAVFATMRGVSDKNKDVAQELHDCRS